MNTNHAGRLNRYKKLLDNHLRGCLLDSEQYLSPLTTSMRYSLLSGGKRLRGILILEFCRLCGNPFESVIDIAAAVEMLHCYSLIHDDLPCMDDDDLRRGMPTNHIKFGEWLALLAGDALQAEAFRILAATQLPPSIVVRIIALLASAVSRTGMCGGQFLDMYSNTITPDELRKLHSLKTGALFSAACAAACIASDASPVHIKAAENFGAALGMAFQIRDDMLDYEGNTLELGKLTGSDLKNSKSTFVSLFGLDNCRSLIRNETEIAVNSVTSVFGDTDFLVWLAESLAVRTK